MSSIVKCKVTSLFAFALCFILHVHISAIFCALSCARLSHTVSSISAAKVLHFSLEFPPSEFGTSLVYKMRAINLKTIL